MNKKSINLKKHMNHKDWVGLRDVCYKKNGKLWDLSILEGMEGTSNKWDDNF